VLFAIPDQKITYSGVMNAAGDSIKGTFVQGQSLPLTFGRSIAAAPSRRPQDPDPPFPYQTKDVAFESAPGVRLAGTIDIPQGKGPFPTVVFVTGSGPQDRDEAGMGHRPFLVIADYLARHGIASLRSTTAVPRNPRATSRRRQRATSQWTRRRRCASSRECRNSRLRSAFLATAKEA
jgi:hypothetical protein